MIGSLRGRLVERTMTGQVLVEVGGVGYVTLVPSGTLARLGQPGSEVHLHVSTQVREDAITLYGFSTRDERVCFEGLLAAQGVGPALLCPSRRLDAAVAAAREARVDTQHEHAFGG